MSEQRGREGAGRPHISEECSQSSFLADHVDSMIASRGVLCSYEILNLVGPQVRTDHLQASVACNEPGDQRSQQTATHMHVREQTRHDVPTHDKPVGLHMLTLTLHNKEIWKHSNLCGRRISKNICKNGKCILI